MRWAIYAEGQRPIESLNPMLDITAPQGAPDGVHRIHCAGVNQSGLENGAVIKDGAFVIKPTVQAAFKAACQADGIDAEEAAANGWEPEHPFIEDWTWNPAQQWLEMGAGS